MLRLNLSGHPVRGFDLAPLVGENIPMTSADALVDVIRETLRALPCRETLRALPCRAELLHGASAEVILPGMTCAAGVLLAEWHGAFGSFPTVRWAVRGESGFEWPDEAKVDLNQVRLDSRSDR